MTVCKISGVFSIVSIMNYSVTASVLSIYISIRFNKQLDLHLTAGSAPLKRPNKKKLHLQNNYMICIYGGGEILNHGTN